MVFVTSFREIQSFSHNRLNATDHHDSREIHEISISSHQILNTDNHLQSASDAHQEPTATGVAQIVFQRHDDSREDSHSTEHDDDIHDSIESNVFKRQTQLTADEWELIRQLYRQHGIGSWEVEDLFPSRQHPVQHPEGGISSRDMWDEFHSREREVKDLDGWNSWESAKDGTIYASVEDYSIEDLGQYRGRAPFTLTF